jgi:hypothetical protein
VADMPGHECGELGENLQLRGTVQSGGAQGGEGVLQEDQGVGAGVRRVSRAAGSQGCCSMRSRWRWAMAFRSARQSPLGVSPVGSSPLTWSTISSTSVPLSGA